MSQLYTNILLLTLPLILSNISIPLVGIADTAIAGHFIGVNAIASIGLGAIVFDILYWSFGFLKLATSGTIAQSLGQKNFSQIDIIFFRHIFFAIVLASIIILLKPFIVDIFLHWLQPEVSAREMAEKYINVRLYSAPAVFINYVLLGYFIANQKMLVIFYYSLLLNISNIALSLLFVSSYNMGIEGIALASVASQYIGTLFSLLIIFSIHNTYRPKWSFSTKALFQKQEIMAIFKTNTNIFIRTTSLLFVFFYLAKQGASLGNVILAGNIILLHFQSTMAYALDAFSDVAEALTGKAFGANNYKLLSQTVKRIWVCMGVYAIIVSLLFYLFDTSLISIFTNDTNLIQSIIVFFPWLIISPIISFTCFLFDGVFIGTLHTKEMRNSMVISCASFLGMTYLFIPLWGNHGLWLSFIGFMMMRGLTLTFYYKNKIIKP